MEEYLSPSFEEGIKLLDECWSHLHFSEEEKKGITMGEDFLEDEHIKEHRSLVGRVCVE